MQFKQRMSCKCCLQTHGLWFVGHADCLYTQFAGPASAKCRLWWQLCGIQLKFSSPFRSKYVGGKLCFRGVFLPYPLYPVFMCRPKLIALFILTLKLMEEVWMRAALVTYGIFRLPCAKEGHFLCSDGRHIFSPPVAAPCSAGSLEFQIYVINGGAVERQPLLCRLCTIWDAMLRLLALLCCKTLKLRVIWKIRFKQ